MDQQSSKYQLGIFNKSVIVQLPRYSSSCVMALPIPVPPPVTIADFPLKRFLRKTLLTTAAELFAADAMFATPTRCKQIKIIKVSKEIHVAKMSLEKQKQQKTW